jgi:hypothetical protein
MKAAKGTTKDDAQATSQLEQYSAVEAQTQKAKGFAFVFYLLLAPKERCS